MKKFLIIYVLLCVSVCFSSEWTTTEFYPSSWGSKQICEQLGKGKECFEISESTARYSAKTIQVDDESKPVYKAESRVMMCADYDSCQELRPQHLCLPDEMQIYAESPYRLYCTKLLGYEQKDKLVLALDSVKDAQFQSDKQAKNVEAAKEQAIQNKLKEIQKGQRIIAIMRANSDAKNLTKQQKKTLINSTKEIIEALNIGSLDVAKDLMEAIVPDGVIILESEKQAILGLL